MIATGAFTGLSFQSGEGVTVTAPIRQACSLPHAVIVDKYGGKDVTDILREDLSKKSDLFK